MRLHRRRLYKHVGEVVVPQARERAVSSASEAELLNRILEGSGLEEADVAALRREAYVDKFKLNFGAGAANPVDRVLFYLRNDDTVGRHLGRNQVSSIAPAYYQERATASK